MGQVEFIALSLIILLLSVIIHEVMHGFVALKFGDHTAERAGRLTLNPIPHIDPIGTILLPLILFYYQSPILFGWAKPVPVNPLNFTNLRKGELLVAAAGILANLGIAIICAVLYHVLSIFSIHPFIMQLLEFGVDINLLLAVFNLIPIPPLDGSKVLLSQLPYKAAREFEKIEPYGPFILLAMMFIPFGRTNILGFILGNLTGLLKVILGF